MERKGRGAQINTSNKFLQNHYTLEEIDFVDEDDDGQLKTRYFFESPKKIVNKVASPDVGMLYSINPYQGCEHGCIYCYARNTHEYYGFSAGLDFESKIIVKKNAPQLLREKFENKNWKPYPIAMSGNTDCYQPIEKKLKITRSLLDVFWEYKNPVGFITKNALILRDIDILKKLAKENLVMVNFSVTTLNESLRRELEPRTATIKKRLEAIEQLTSEGIPVGVMAAPIIPGLNDHEIPEIVKTVASKGAKNIGYTVVRLNGAIGPIFKNWIEMKFPEKASKVLNLIASCHNGNLNDSRWGKRMRGEGEIAQVIAHLFEINKRKYLPKNDFQFNLKAFRRPGEVKQLDMFG